MHSILCPLTPPREEEKRGLANDPELLPLKPETLDALIFIRTLLLVEMGIIHSVMRRRNSFTFTSTSLRDRRKSGGRRNTGTTL